MPWRITWSLRRTAVLEGLTREQEGQAELAGHFLPRAIVAWAEEEVRAQTGVLPGDVVRLVITVERA
jgi:hypothetical protein